MVPSNNNNYKNNNNNDINHYHHNAVSSNSNNNINMIGVKVEKGLGLQQQMNIVNQNPQRNSMNAAPAFPSACMSDRIKK